MRLSFRPRLTLFSAMVIVATFAGFFAFWAAAERRKHIVALAAELVRLEDRVNWAGRMNQRGYVSKAQLASERKTRDAVRVQLKLLGALPEGR